MLSLTSATIAPEALSFLAELRTPGEACTDHDPAFGISTEVYIQNTLLKAHRRGPNVSHSRPAQPNPTRFSKV